MCPVCNCEKSELIMRGDNNYSNVHWEKRECKDYYNIFVLDFFNNRKVVEHEGRNVFRDKEVGDKHGE